MYAPGPAETLALRIGLALARSAAGARRRDMSELWQHVQRARHEGVVLLARIKGAEDNEDNRRWLAGAVVDWWSQFELKLEDLAPELLAEFRSLGIPAGRRWFVGSEEVAREDETADLDALAEVVRDDLRRLKRMHRRIVWPHRRRRIA